MDRFVLNLSPVHWKEQELSERELTFSPEGVNVDVRSETEVFQDSLHTRVLGLLACISNRVKIGC